MSADREGTPDRHELVDEALAFAARRLGPASAEAMATADSQAKVLSRVRHGATVEDAVLAEAHRLAQEDRAVADEFLAHFLQDMLRLGSRTLSAGLRRFLDTGDLVQSVMGEVWRELGNVEFRNRPGFMALLNQRLKWKASDRAKHYKAKRRQEDKRDPRAVEDVFLADSTVGPVGHNVSREDLERLILVLMRLPDRDRHILTMHMRGESLDEVAEDLGVARESARKAIQRAVKKAKDIVAEDDAAVEGPAED